MLVVIVDQKLVVKRDLVFVARGIEKIVVVEVGVGISSTKRVMHLEGND